MSISLTEASVLAIKTALNERSKGIGIRLEVSVGGISSLSFRLEYADELRDTDLCFEHSGFRVVTDLKNLAYTEGLVLDYSQTNGEGGFSVCHAEPCDECGCGSG
ncbi:iron-sulfur cluster assembly protein IscA [Uliginosibacterium flavum]|uniref:Iron-sulfur cluster assembly accessory protein n=1 Tax=Uliginosibacterium flavum TaxID=1396831 RepID=A0ABV2THF4_9RHOO